MNRFTSSLRRPSGLAYLGLVCALWCVLCTACTVNPPPKDKSWAPAIRWTVHDQQTGVNTSLQGTPTASMKTPTFDPFYVTCTATSAVSGVSRITLDGKGTLWCWADQGAETPYVVQLMPALPQQQVNSQAPFPAGTFLLITADLSSFNKAPGDCVDAHGYLELTCTAQNGGNAHKATSTLMIDLKTP